MAYDGTVKIGTELDGSGIKKGLQETCLLYTSPSPRDTR